MSFFESTDSGKKRSDVIFDTGEKPIVSGLLEVITRGSELNQSAVDIVLAVFCRSQVLEDTSICIVKLSLQGFVGTQFNERCGIHTDPESIMIPRGCP